MEAAATKIVREYCIKWPDHGNLTIAKALYKHYPHIWSGVESVRREVRRVRGAQGEEKRKEIKDKSLFREPRKAGQQIELPESLAKKWEPFVCETRRNAILSDIHLPFHDAEALKLAIAETKKYNPTGIVLNGDICDFLFASRWDVDPREIDAKAEIERTKQFLGYMRQQFPKAEIIYKEGNHEFRWQVKLWKKAPELLDVPDFHIESIFELDKFGIQYVKDQRPIMLGKFPLFHGHEFPKGISAPVNQARGMFMRALESCGAGHGHRSSEHAEMTMNGRLVHCVSFGCLCDRTPAYARINKWNSGFGFIETDKDGGFHIQNKRIHKGQVW
jgi:hypothetical protein